jgi:hypothetical protein
MQDHCTSPGWEVREMAGTTEALAENLPKDIIRTEISVIISVSPST